MHRLVIALVIAACAKPVETAEPMDIPPPRPRPDAAAPPPAATAPPVVLASCPATYTEAAAGKCGHDRIGTLECTYPDGHCGCRDYRPCSGVPYDVSKSPRIAEWQCAPTERSDGCPGDEPREGAPCTPRPGMCAYAPCGGQVYACRKQRWVVDHTIPPPP